MPRVRSKEKGDLLKGCECGTRKGIVSKEVGEGRDNGVALRGAVGAGKNHKELVTRGVGRAVREVAKLVGDVPVGGLGVELVGREGTALASQDGGGGWRRVWGEDRGRLWGTTSSVDVRPRCII